MVRDRLLASAPVVRGPRPADAATARTSTGVPGLDPLLDGGLPAHRAVVLCGAEGTGKTTFGLQFLAEGLRRGEPGALVSADAKPAHVVEDAASLGIDFGDAIARGTLVMLDASPYFTALRGRGVTSTNELSTAQRRLKQLTGHLVYSGVDAREVASDLALQVRRIGAKRLVVDSITSLVPHDLDRGQAGDYLRSLIQSLEDNLGCTIVLTCRSLKHDQPASCEAARYLAAGILELRFRRRGSGLARTLCIRKMRGTRIEAGDYPVTIEPGCGLAVHEADLFPSVQPAVFAVRPA